MSMGAEAWSHTRSESIRNALYATPSDISLVLRALRGTELLLQRQLDKVCCSAFCVVQVAQTVSQIYQSSQAVTDENTALKRTIAQLQVS